MLDNRQSTSKNIRDDALDMINLQNSKKIPNKNNMGSSIGDPANIAAEA